MLLVYLQSSSWCLGSNNLIHFIDKELRPRKSDFNHSFLPTASQHTENKATSNRGLCRASQGWLLLSSSPSLPSALPHSRPSSHIGHWVSLPDQAKIVSTSGLFFLVCIGSLLLCAGFLYLQRAGATLHCSARASHCGGFSCCRARARGVQASVVVAHGLSSHGTWALEHRFSSCGARA